LNPLPWQQSRLFKKYRNRDHKEKGLTKVMKRRNIDAL